MTDRSQRSPTAFSMQDVSADASPPGKPRKKPARKPTTTEPAKVRVIAPEDDVFNAPVATENPAPDATPRRRRRFTAGRLLATALGLLVSAAIALWVDQLVRDLFTRNDWLGWTAAAVAAVAAATVLFIVAREIWALRRLAHLGTLRDKARDALRLNDTAMGRAAADALVAHMGANPATARGRAAMAETRGEIIDGADLVRLAETEILVPLDRQARVMILDAAKRVSVVTAVSPRALVDVGYVLFESARLVRRIADLYGARPGALGFMRLARDIVAHIAITGGIAMGDSLIQQLVGHGVAARLSARLGEGVVNAMMTARIGIAAMEVVRPFSFSVAPRPGLTDIARELVSFQKDKTEPNQPDPEEPPQPR